MPPKFYRLSLSVCVLLVGVALAGLALAALNQLAPLDVPAAQNVGANASGEIPATWWATVQENLRREIYAFNPGGSAEKAYHADNPAQRLRVTFAPEGLRLSSLNNRPSPPSLPAEIQKTAPQSNWDWSLRLSAYGVEEKNPQPLEVPQLTTQGDRLEYHYTAPIIEWYLNNPRGLEQGFTILKHEAFDASPSTFFLDLTLTTNLHPSLSADGQTLDFHDLNGVPVLRYDHLYAHDATGRELAAYLTLLPKEKENPSLTLRLNVNTTGAVFPLTIDPLTTSPNWTGYGETLGDEYGISVATAGDVNGDGYSDVIVSAAYHTGGANTDEGRVYVYHGTANGLSLTPAFTATGEGSGNFFGISAGTAGDVNGDGYSDVIIGALGYNGLMGRVYLYTGSSTGLSATPALTLTGEAGNDSFGSQVGTAGDVNGDGYSDVIIAANGYNTNTGRAYIYHGSGAGLSATPAITFTGETSSDRFGIVAGIAGDVNGDGYSDVVIGANGYDTSDPDAGRAYVYHGSGTGLSATPAFTATGDGIYSFFGNAAGTAGDVNGDGYSDVVIGASGYAGIANPFRGRAYLYLGSASGLTTSTLIAIGEGNNDQMGSAVGTAGDMNGDGYADVIIGAHRYPNDQKTGRAYLYLGQSTGLSASPLLTFTGQITDSRLGTSVGTAGDVNGDGYADLLLGEPGPFTTPGQAYIYLGSANPLSDAAIFTATGENSGDALGASVATAGDVNGDGYADVIVGAPDYYDLDSSTYPGRVYLYAGSTTGLSATPAITLTGENDADAFGAAVATAGDINGDGYADVIIGAPGCGCGAGQVYVYTGSSGGLNATPVFTAAGEMQADFFGNSVGTAGDVNGDGYADVVIGAPGYLTDTGRIYLYLGRASGLNSTPAFTATGQTEGDGLGAAVGTAGDVNRDGYTDVIAGAPNYDNYTGRIYLYRGSATGLSVTPVFTATGENFDNDFGTSVGTAGDVNGDGYADVIIGADYYDGDAAGRAYVYHGSASGLNATPVFTLTGESSGDFLSNAVGTAGDVNGDGYADIILGVYGHSGGDFQGRAYVHTGSATGLSATPALTVTGESTDDGFGISVGTAGDVNGDGYAEVIVGADGYSGYQGRAYVYAGNGNYGVTVRPQQRRNDNSAPIAPAGQSESLSGFRLAALGRSPFGRGKVKLEWEVKPLGTAFNGASLQRSAAWLDSGTAGAALNELVTGLSTGAHYHWRVRVLYHPATTPFQIYSRWFTQPWNGWQENDLLTADQAITGVTAANNSPKFVGQSVAFTATVTTGTNVTYVWNFGDGQTGSGITTTHKYTAPGVYTSTLTALNSDSVITVTKPVTITLLKIYLPVVRR